MHRNLWLFIALNLLVISFQLECRNFRDDTCGGHNKEYKLQCHKFTSGCKEVEVDDGCEINSSHKCVAKSGIGENEDCVDFGDEKKCKKIKKICENYYDKNCGGLNGIKDTDTKQCLQFNSGDNCKEVTIDEYCKANENYNCVGRKSFDETKNKCAWNEKLDECKLREKTCEDFSSSCSEQKVSITGRKCAKIEGYSNCREIEVSPSCKIDNDGKCKIEQSADKKDCQFNSGKNKCQLFEIDSECQVSLGYCQKKNNANLQSGKTCGFIDEEETKCKVKDKECEDYPGDSTCEAAPLSANKKCSVYFGYCQEYTIDSFCTVEGGVCKKAEGKNINNDEDCLFDEERTSCTKKKKICSNYYDYEKCEKLPLTDTTQCIYDYIDYKCKELQIDKDCKFIDFGSECVHRDSNFDQKKGICSYSDDRKSCKLRERKCYEYTNNACNDLENCIFDNGRCYEIDNYCTMKNGICAKKENANLPENEKCNSNFISCKKQKPPCSEYNSDKCSDFPKTSEEQCFKFSDRSTCSLVELDGNCYVDKNGKCVEDGSGKLSSNEICAFNNDISRDRCRKREKQCSDITDDTCDKFTPLTKLCFKFEDEHYCKEVKVDSGCQINEDNECTGQNCSFDEDKERCFKREDDGSLLNLKPFILMLLFFAF